MNSLEQAEDLKAFERRLTEYIHCLQPATGRWRMLLIVVSVCTATGAWNWLIDPETQKVSFFTSLWNHPFFTISCITLIGLFFAGIHKRVVAPSIHTHLSIEALEENTEEYVYNLGTEKHLKTQNKNAVMEEIGHI
uniref:Nuclear envelope phosphatase-regulatory subunit 1 n=1 Tax=Equus caballus TaxID=9796 RepID=A0A9L0TSI6_HORSE